ncbi:MAG: enoyl-CoA hydratase/isomerase family protein [Salinivirgaceae bacterium]
MKYSYIECTQRDKVLLVRLNRPEKLNAINFSMVQELNHLFTSIDIDKLNALFITGNEKAFSAGGDLSEMKTLSKAGAEKQSQYLHHTFQMLQTLPIPSVAFISGICLGGGLELAMHCDIRMAAENAQLGFPELKYGIIPGAGGTVLLPEQMGYNQAAYYLLTGETIPVETAQQQGLIQQLIPTANFEASIEHLILVFNALNAQAIKATKTMLQLNRQADINTRCKNEAQLFAELLETNIQKGVGERF